MSDQGFVVQVDDGYDEAVVRTRLALKAEGFSIITEMHVGGVLGEEAGDERQYLIMGGWSRPGEKQGVDSDLQVAVYLPCNIVISETGASAMVAALDPMEDVEQGDDNSALAGTARDALTRALGRVSD